VEQVPDHKPVEAYIPHGHVPFAEPVSQSYFKAAEELLLPFPATGLQSFPKLDSLIGGFRPNEFSILCGSTGTGKTTLLANWSASWLVQGVPQFVASVETGRTDYVKRVMSSLVGEDWNRGDAISLSKLQSFGKQYERLIRQDTLHLSRYENRFSVETLMADIAWHVKHKGVKVAMVDNLNFFLDVKRSSDQLIEMDRVVHELVIFSKNVPVHIIMIMHPKKPPGSRDTRVESEFDIKGSSTAVQEAYNIFLFNRPSEEMLESGYTKFHREVKIVKLRRRGTAVGVRLMLSSQHGVRYLEDKLYE
jgi:replicative DNA helicase